MTLTLTPASYLRSLGIERVPSAGECNCHDCSGAGYFLSDNGPAPIELDCETCDGSGLIEASDATCDYCDGPVDEDGFCETCGE